MVSYWQSGTWLKSLEFFVSVAHVELRNLLGNPEETQSECDALIAHFLIGDTNLQLVNLALKVGSNIALLNEKIADLISEEESVVLCIDLANFHESDGK